MIINGDCIEEMKKLPDNSVDALITDPPYELGFMGKHWDNTGIANNVQMWKEAYRVLKSGAYLLSFGGTRTYHRMACAIEDAGFEIRDCIEWVYGSGFPKSLNIGKAVDKLQGNEREVVGKSRNGSNSLMGGLSNTETKTIQDITKGNSEWEGWGTALKPSHEPIVMARKPLSEKTVAENVLKWGTGGINIDESRVEAQGKDLDKLNSEWDREWNTDYSDYADKVGGSAGFNMDKAKKENAGLTGRFPANLIHDNSEEVRECFPNTKPTKPHGGDGGKLDTQEMGWGFKRIPCNLSDDGGSASRFFKTCEFSEEDFDYPPFFYTAKASKSERNEGCEELEEKQMDLSRKEGNPGGDNPRNRGVHIRTNHHPTVKPLKLMEYLIKMVTPPGGTILEPFAGSGSTLVAAKKLGYKFIGIEKEAEYIKIIEARLSAIKEVKKDLKSNSV